MFQDETKYIEQYHYDIHDKCNTSLNGEVRRIFVYGRELSVFKFISSIPHIKITLSYCYISILC